MSEMAEKVARALCRASFDGIPDAALDEEVENCWRVWTPDAIVAIKAMRELPESLWEDGGVLDPDVIGAHHSPETYWEAIIDAALAPEKEMG